MRLIIALLLFVAILGGLDYLNRMNDLKDVKMLYNQFENWIDSRGKSKRPSNAVFANLFKKYSTDEKVTATYYEGFPGAIRAREVNLIPNFPLLDKQLVGGQMSLLENMYDFFQLRFDEMRDPVYWINAFLLLPKNIIEYLGLNTDNWFVKLLNFLYWIGGIIWTAYESRVISYLQNLFR